MIGYIVDSCHVGMSDRAVIWEIVSRLKGKYAGWRKLSREDRRLVMRQAIKRHHENQDLYRDVMGGRI